MCLCSQIKIMVQTFHTPPVQRQTVQLKVLGEYWLNQPWKERRQTRWRRAWHVLFVRTYCMTLSGVSGLLCHVLSHWHGNTICVTENHFRSVCALACSHACMSSVLPATRAGWSVLLIAPPAAAPWRGFVRATSSTTWWRPTSFSTQVCSDQDGLSFCQKC